MAKGFWVKTGVGQLFDDVRNFYVKTGIGGWAQVTDAWVKTSTTTWSRFWDALMAPTSRVELLSDYAGTNNETLRLQGKNYKWVPAPQTLKYYFRWIPDSGSTYYIGASGSSGDTTSNPVTSTILPGSTSYITISPTGTNYELGKINRYYFEVRATGASGSVYSSISQEDVTIVSPKAPTLSFTVLSSTTVSLEITSADYTDWINTGRYILYTYDGTAGYVYSGGGRGGFAATTQTITRTLTLVSGRTYTVYVLPITGTSGTTPTSYSGYPGIEASLSNVKTGSSDPQAFTSISFTKAHPASSSQGVVRTTDLSWNASTNATRYEILYEGKTNNGDAWTTVQTFGQSPYEVNTSQSKSWGSPVPAGGFTFYNFMRAKIRASNPDSTVTVISDNDVYIEASGVAPGTPGFGNISYPTTTSVSIAFTAGSDGSNYLDSSLEYMYRTDSGSYPSTWSTTGISPSSNSGTITFSTVGGTKYWVKMRTRNLDNLYSPEPETSFTPPAAPTLATGIRRSINTGTTFTNSSTVMYVSTNGYIAYGNNTPSSISIPTVGYVLNIFGPNDLSQTTTGGVQIQASYKNTASYFVVSWRGRYLSSSTETLEYEARFYWNSDLVEVNCITNNLTALHYQSDNAVYSNGSATKTWKDNSSSISSWTSDTGMITAGAPTASDDGYTAITATKPVIKGTGTKRIIPLGITVTSGSTIAYVSTNGFIGLNSDPSTSISVPSSGRYLNILAGDLKQTALYTKATSTTYSIRYQGHQLSDTSQTVDYEILFTFGSTSAQVYIIANNLTATASDTVLTVDGSGINTWSGTNASTMSATADTALTTNNNVDDARTAITLTAPVTVSIPTNSTAPTLTGGLNVGDTFTFGVGTWNNTPTSYSLRLYRGTASVATSETLVKDAGNVTSSTYVIQASDFTSTPTRLYFRAFATATNSAGTSNSGTYTAGAELGPITNTVTVTAPGTPAIGAVSGSGSVSWTAPTTGGAVASYEIEFYTASNGSGTGAAGPYSVTGIASSPYQLISPYGGTGANWARARVRARNTGGASSYSAWAPSETTYA